MSEKRDDLIWIGAILIVCTIVCVLSIAMIIAQN